MEGGRGWEGEVKGEERWREGRGGGIEGEVGE